MANNDTRTLLRQGTRLLWTASTASPGPVSAGTRAPTRAPAGSARWRQWAVRRLGEGAKVADTGEGFPAPGEWVALALGAPGRLAWLPPFAALDAAGQLDAFMQACGRTPRDIIGAALDVLPDFDARASLAPLADADLAVLVRHYGVPAPGRDGGSRLAQAVHGGSDATVAALVAAGAAWTPEDAAHISSRGALDSYLDSGGDPGQDRLADGQSVLMHLYDAWHAGKQGGAALIQHLHARDAGLPWAATLLHLAQASALQRLHTRDTMKEVDLFMAKHPEWRGYGTRSRLDAMTQWLVANPGMALRWLTLRGKVDPPEVRQALGEAVRHNPVGVLRAVGEAFDDASGAGNKMGYLPRPGAGYGRQQPGKILREAAWTGLFDAPDSVGLLGGADLPRQGSRALDGDKTVDYGAITAKKKRIEPAWCSRLDRVPAAWLWGRSEASQAQAARNLRRMIGLDGDFVEKRNAGLGNLLHGFVKAFIRARLDGLDMAPELCGEGVLWTRLLHSDVFVRSGTGNENMALRIRPRFEGQDETLLQAAPLGADDLMAGSWLSGQVGDACLEALATEISARSTQAALAGGEQAARPRRRA